MSKKTKLNDCTATIALFVLILAAASVMSVIMPDREFSPTENRMLSQRPRISLQSVMDGKFMNDYESFVSDQFFFRDGWIAFKTWTERLLLLREESKGVYFAKDDYLIESHAGTFDTALAAQNVETLVKFVAEYASRFEQGRFTVMIAPNAVDVHSEKLPRSAPAAKGNSYRDAIASRLPPGTFCDVLPELRARDEEYLYFRTDHHWTMRAAFYAYRAFTRQTGLSATEFSDCTVSVAANGFEGTVSSKIGISPKPDYIEAIVPISAETARMHVDGMDGWYELFDTKKCSEKEKDNYAYFLGGNYPFAQIRTDSEHERRMLVIKDSYANCFVPFLTNNFSEIGILDMRYARQSVRSLIDGGEWTDVIVLYNAAGFAADESIERLLH